MRRGFASRTANHRVMGSEQDAWSVLLVDDTIDLRLLMRLALERTGRFKIVGEAGNGQEGVGLAEVLQPDLVVLDLNMPVMDGAEALPLIRAASPRSKIVIFSGLDGNAAEWGSAGASGYVVKGTSATEIITQLGVLMEAS